MNTNLIPAAVAYSGGQLVAIGLVTLVVKKTKNIKRPAFASQSPLDFVRANKDISHLYH